MAPQLGCLCFGLCEFLVGSHFQWCYWWESSLTGHEWSSLGWPSGTSGGSLQTAHEIVYCSSVQLEHTVHAFVARRL